MSSVAGGINISSEEFQISSFVPSLIAIKPSTTEPSEVASSSKDDQLSTNRSSKSFSNTSTISSSVAIPSGNNGGLRSNKSVTSSSSPRISQFDTGNSFQQNDLLENPENLPLPIDKELCRFYDKNGFCRFGKNCRYSHLVVPRPCLEKRRPYVSEKYTRATSIEVPQDGTASTENHAEPRQPDKREEICRFFSRKGRCRFGDSCRYSHRYEEPDRCSTEPNTASGAEATLNEISEDKRNYSNLEKSKSGSETTVLKPSKPCSFFSRYGRCAFGDRCKYLHIKPKKKPAVRNKESPEKSATNGEPCKSDELVAKEPGTDCQQEANYFEQENNMKLQQDDQNKVIEPKTVSLRNKAASEMTSDDFQKLRKTEINQLKKKFPGFNLVSLPEGGCVFEVVFSSTDPDWRFDVKSVNLSIMVPDTYPQENLQVDCLNPDGILPEKLVRYFNKTTFTWLQDQHERNEKNDRVELILRPFLKWLDKSLEDIFICGLKMVKREMEAAAAGIQFVTHEELNAKNKTKEPTPPPLEPAPTEPSSSYTTDYDYEDTSDFPYSMDHQSIIADQNLVNRSNRSNLDTARRGTEVKLRSLEMLDGAGTLTCSRLTVTVQCGRCKLRSDVGAMSHRGHRIDCEKCHHQQKLTFRPVVMHPFSSVAGYLDLDNCQVVDVPLLTCEFAVTCLPCGRQNLLTGMQYGQCQTTWCLFCHSKMSVSVESLKLNQLQPNTEPITNATQVVKLEKKDKKVKDPAIQEGKPLPENGTCKHYKKSFRWLRFPCCGKAYPCDACHDEKETDHDMKLATRMICGFCAKEQVYSSDRPCVLCGGNMTKKSGAHWEGGRGCRDKIKMSKDDRQKYVGCNKTVPKKVQSAAKKEK